MNKRLKQLRESLGLNQGEFAQKINIVQQQLSKYERNINKPSSDFFKILAEKTTVNINWLITGEGPMFTNENGTNIPQGAVLIPFYKNSDCINNKNVYGIQGMYFDKNIIKNNWKCDESKLRLIQMPGDTMDGENTPIKNEDILIIDTSINEIIYSGIYAYTTRSQKFIFVNIIKQEIDGSLVFDYRNKKYEKTVYSISDLEKIKFNVIGKVIKNISNNNV